MAFVKYVIEDREGMPFDDELYDADVAACVAQGLALKGHVCFTHPVSVGCDADCEGCTLLSDDAREGCHHASFLSGDVDAAMALMEV